MGEGSDDYISVMCWIPGEGSGSPQGDESQGALMMKQPGLCNPVLLLPVYCWNWLTCNFEDQQPPLVVKGREEAETPAPPHQRAQGCLGCK